MVYNYNGVKVYYKFYGKRSNEPTLLLHGWGRSSEDFKGLTTHFSDRCFLVIDFPPFGKSDKEPLGWTIFTYVQMLMSLCEHLGIKGCHLVGHSFGGRVAIIMSAIMYSYVKSCILVDSAGMKPRHGIKYQYRVMRYKIRKKLGKSTNGFGSADYKALSPEMQKTFVNIVQTNLEDYAKTISLPSLIIWGKNDNQTPLYMAKRLNRLIQNSKLRILEDGGHFSFLDCPLEFYGAIKDFWG